MKQAIPAITLRYLLSKLSPQAERTDFFLREIQPPAPLVAFPSLALPHRMDFYALGMCYGGTIELCANLETYVIQEGSVVLIGPEVIRKWRNQTPDYTAKALFFTDDCFTATQHGASLLKRYDFYLDPLAPKVFQATAEEAHHLKILIALTGHAMQSPSKRKAEILQAYLSIVLNRVADMYERVYPRPQTAHALDAPDTLAKRFKLLVLQHCLYLRSVAGYAKQLHVSAKHLSETVKSETGKTAGEWIHDTVILEAKVLLKQTAQTVAQVADALHFADATLFAKYFRRYAGQSPLEYRRSQGNDIAA